MQQLLHSAQLKFSALRFLQAEAIDKQIAAQGIASIGPLAGIPIAVKV